MCICGLHSFVHVACASVTHTQVLLYLNPPPPNTHSSPSTSMSSVKTGGWIRFDKFCSVWPRVRTGSTKQQRKTMFFSLLPPNFWDFLSLGHFRGKSIVYLLAGFYFGFFCCLRSLHRPDITFTTEANLCAVLGKEYTSIDSHSMEINFPADF